MACFPTKSSAGPPRARRYRPSPVVRFPTHGAPSPMACFPMQGRPGPPRARRPCPSPMAALPRRVAQGRCAQGGLSPIACFPTRPGPPRARAAVLPLADSAFSHAGCSFAHSAFPAQGRPGQPRAQRPCPSPIMCFPAQSGPAPRS
eukprot:7763756-Pyramimonas_sp.AAC.1